MTTYEITLERGKFPLDNIIRVLSTQTEDMIMLVKTQNKGCSQDISLHIDSPKEIMTTLRKWINTHGQYEASITFSDSNPHVFTYDMGGDSQIYSVYNMSEKRLVRLLKDFGEVIADKTTDMPLFMTK